MDNKQIAEVFNEIGNILDIKGESFFRVNAYRRAALTVTNLPYDLRKMIDGAGIKEKIPGIGKDLEAKIVEMIETGKCSFVDKIKVGFPVGLLEILKIRGIGPKKVKLFYNELAIKTIPELKKAGEAGMLRTLEKMGEKSESEILKAIDEFSQFSSDRTMINEAQMEAERVIAYLNEFKGMKRIQFCGSLRRRQETIGDIDILVVADGEGLMEHFCSFEDVINVIAQGDTKSSVIMASGIQCDLRLVPDESFGAAAHYFTGSKEHNIRMRDLAKKKGLKLNEYGLMDGDKAVAGKTEEGIFKKLGLPFIPPEMRQNSGEIEYGLKHGKMPALVELKDIRGDVHTHSTYSDGKKSIAEMAKCFKAKGYDYFAVTDHSAAMAVTGGMKDADIRRQWKEIDKLDVGIKILKGCEVDILKDGTLDFSDEILKELDIVIISAHMFGQLDSDEQTKRLIAAVENKYSMIMGHPTGRLVNKRKEMDFNMSKVIDACVANKVALEINANPMRLDLVDKYLRMAQEKGAKFVINTDSHDIRHTDFMDFGVGVARRGWLEAKDVLNTKSWKDMKAYWIGLFKNGWYYSV
ncbi:DNA polymerase/3'-5' exonuclease PolX [Candidatus Gracilibacteria bacterium]|nr:DNA polymerase/3'-5' exonuclease PolX [Candidatus Gracilibacteria bacterium]